MTEHERGAHVFMVERILEREDRRLMAFDEFGNLVVQLGQSMGQGMVASKPQHTAFEETTHPGSSIPRLDHAVPRDLSAGVDAQNPHVIPSPPPWLRRRCRSW